MNDPVTSQVFGPYGPVNTGSGGQHNFLFPGPKGRTPRAQAADDMRWIAQRFVHPEGFHRARDILELHRTVFLDALAGSGRITAAKMLLWELRPNTENLHELLPQEAGRGSRLDLSHIGDGDRAWLDLTSVGELWEEIRDELSGLRAAVQAHQAHLVVVLPQEVDDLPSEFERYIAKIRRPPVHEVLYRYLKIDNIILPHPVPPLQFLTSDPSLARINRYVRLVREAMEKASGESTFGDWCDTAYRALSGRATEVDGLVAKLDQGPQRALLLVTAMLHGAHADSIYDASSLFLQVVKQPADERPMLERSTLYHRLQEIGAEVDGSGHINFKEPGYDSAVRDYFWIHEPELRTPMRTWVRTAVDANSVPTAERQSLVRRFAEQCLNGKYFQLLISLAEEWTGRSMVSSCMEAAALVLQCGLRDEKYGRAFRKQIYDWSRMDNLPDSRAEVIIAACRDEMAVTHPDEALVRLHHVARRERRTRARDTLIELAHGDRRFLRQLLSRLTDANPEGKMGTADAGIFLDLVDPSIFTDSDAGDPALMADHVTCQQVTDGWQLAFTQVPREAWGPRAQQWLRCASRDGRYADTLLNVLIEGAQRRADVLASLYAMTRTRELRAEVSDRVFQKINTSWGVQSA